jgi:hypothetical protein
MQYAFKMRGFEAGFNLKGWAPRGALPSLRGRFGREPCRGGALTLGLHRVANTGTEL